MSMSWGKGQPHFRLISCERNNLGNKRLITTNIKHTENEFIFK